MRRYYGLPVECCAQVLDPDGKTSVKCQGKDVSKLKSGTHLKWVESPENSNKINNIHFCGSLTYFMKSTVLNICT